MGRLAYTSWSDKPVIRKTNKSISLDDFDGCPGYALLLMAANTHLTVTDLLVLLDQEGQERSRKWVGSRRWLFQQPGTINPCGVRPNRDGRDEVAVSIMRANTALSLRDLVRKLGEHGIRRGKDWVRRHRCDQSSG